MDISVVTRVLVTFLASFVLTPAYVMGADSGAVSDGTTLKKVITAGDAGENLLNPTNWRHWQKGFERADGIFICDNASDAQVQRGLSQTVVLNQTRPEPIVAAAWSKADGVGGSRGSDYSLCPVFNDSTQRRTVSITLDRTVPKVSRELIYGRTITWRDRRTELTLDGEDVAVIEID